MKIVRPLAITDAILTSSNVAETDYTPWNSGTTYALDAFVRVVGADIHKVYKSKQAGNINHDPATSPDWWLDAGSTNKWRMFDAAINSQTTNASTITCTFNITQRIDSLVLLNVAAASVSIVMDSGGSTVYTKSVSLISDSGITDFYGYFFEPIERITDVAVTDLPLYGASTVTLTISNPGLTAACGACVIGLSADIGGLQYGAKVGIRNYSVKSVDAFGNQIITSRAYANTANYLLMIENTKFDRIKNMLTGYLDVPIVWIGSPDYAGSVIYGFYKDFSLEIAYPNNSLFTLELEGLT